MKGFTHKHLLLILGLLGVLALVFKPFGKKQTASPLVSAKSLPGKSIEVLSVPSKAEAVNAVSSIPAKRNQARDRLAIGSSLVKPTLSAQGMQIVFEIHPIGRDCQNGDIDLIKSAIGADGKLLLTVEDGSKNLFEKTLTLTQMKSKVVVPLTIKPTDKLQTYRLSLCSDNRRGSCNKLRSMDFKKLERMTVKNPGETNLTADYLFYTYNFAAFDGGIHLFDSTKERPAQQYRKYMASHKGSDGQLNFLTQSLDEAKKLGVIPAQIKDNRIVLPLYYNDKSRCEVSLSRRSQ